MDDAPVEGPASQRHPLALLAILAAHPVGEVSRDQLVAFLWPDRDARRGRHLLSEALYVLRRTSGRDAIRNVGRSLVLNADLLWTDVRAFREATDAGDHHTAVEVYGGPFLDGFHLPSDGEFQHWVDGRRTYFELRHAGAVDALAAGAAASGNELEAAHWLRLRLAEDPFSGSSTRKLMTALARAGDRAEAIRVGRAYETRVRDELGLPPAEDVTRLRARLEGPHWIVPRPPPRRWIPGRSADRRAAGRVREVAESGADVVPPAPPVPDAPARAHILRSWRALSLGASVVAILVVAAALLLGGLHLAASAARSGVTAAPFSVAVIPLASCCTPALAFEAERFALTLADTLDGVPDHVAVAPGRVMSAWHRAASSSEGAPAPDRFAAEAGAVRYLTGSLVEVDPAGVRAELSLRQVGLPHALYARHTTASPGELRAALESLAGGLAEYLRGEAAGRHPARPALFFP